MDDVESPQTIKQWYAALGVEDWSSGYRGLQLPLPVTPAGMNPPADVEIIVNDLTTWMRLAVTDPESWTAANPQAALDAFSPAVSPATRAWVEETWHASAEGPLVFTTIFGPDVEVLENPKVTANLSTFLNSEGEVEFAVTAASVYAVRMLDDPAREVLALPMVRQVSFTSDIAGTWYPTGTTGVRWRGGRST